MTMHHHGHSSPNGLGLADSLGHTDLNWSRLQSHEGQSPELGDSPDATRESEVESDAAETQDPSATQPQEDPAELYRRLFEISKRQGTLERTVSAAQIFESDVDDSPVEDDGDSEVHKTVAAAFIVASPHNSPELSPTPTNSSPVDTAAPIIQETPHDLGGPRVLSIWARDEDAMWRPAYHLRTDKNQQMVKFPGQEHATTVFGHETKPLELEIGTAVKTGMFEGEFRVTDLIKDSDDAFCTTNHYSRVEIIVGSQPEMVPVEQLYIQPHPKRLPNNTEDTANTPRPKRPELAPSIFEGCVFAITQSSDDTLGDTITSHGGTLVDSLDSLVDIDGNWKGNQSLVFGAVLAPAKSKTPKFLQALAMGWPCLSVKYIHASIKEDQLIGLERYLLASPDRIYPDLSLEQQFNCRTVVLGQIIPPLYWVGDRDSPLRSLLAIASAKQVLVADELAQVPKGSLAVAQRGESKLGPVQAQQLSRKRLLRETICMSKDWLVECILEGTII